MIEILRPNAPGDECGIAFETGAACPNHYQNINEEVPDENATVVKTDMDYQRDLYHLPASSGSGLINFIEVCFRCARYAGGAAKPSIKSGLTVDDGTEVILGGWITYSERWATNPNTGAPWEWPDIDDLQIGVSLRGIAEGMAYCTQVYVEVNYTPEVAPAGCLPVVGAGILLVAGIIAGIIALV